MEKFIYEEFEQELKKFSRSEGKILIRLVHRQTGTTTYDLVKELRTGWKAFWYEATASLFKLSLKDTFDPEYSFEDYLIEDILQRAFADQYLEEQASSLDYNLDDLYYIWKDKKTTIPYLTFVRSLNINRPELELGTRKQMKALTINPKEDSDIF